MKDGARGIQSVEVSGRILRALVAAGEPMMLKDLAEAADLKPAQCHAYLTSLKNVGLVHQDWATGLYAAGPFALRLGVSWIESDPLISSAIDQLKALSEEMGVMSLVIVWGQLGPTIIHIHAGPTQAALNLRQGSLFSVTGTATGRVFAAFSDTPELRAQIEAELSQKAQYLSIGELLTAADFEKHVAEIREHGYSVAREKPIPAVNAVSVPLFAPDGELFCVATLIGSSDVLLVDDNAPGIEKMRQIADNLAMTAKQAADLRLQA